jgi:hypothetical protein
VHNDTPNLTRNTRIQIGSQRKMTSNGTNFARHTDQKKHEFIELVLCNSDSVLHILLIYRILVEMRVFVMGFAPDVSVFLIYVSEN